MKAAEWHQRGRSSNFIVKLKKKIYLTILRLDKTNVTLKVRLCRFENLPLSSCIH